MAESQRRLRSKLDLLRNVKSIVDFDPEISNRAFQFRVTQEQLDRSKIAGLLVNQRCLCSAHGMSAISRAVEAGARHPFLYNARILPRGDVWSFRKPAREHVARTDFAAMIEPILDRRASLVRQFELNGPSRFLLGHDRAIPNAVSKTDIGSLQANEVAPS